MKPSTEERLWSKIEFDTNGGCWLWIGVMDGRGYGNISIANRPTKAHRASYMVFVGPIPDGMCVCHSCDVRACVNPHHLWVGSKKDNADDMVSKGRSAMQNPEMVAEFKARGVYKTGSENPVSILNEEGVSEIKRLLSMPHTVRGIARAFGVSRGSIYAIKKNRTWVSVESAK